MTSRSLFRQFAQEVHGKEAKGFVEIKRQFYDDLLITTDNKGFREESPMNYEKMVYWLIGKIKKSEKKYSTEDFIAYFDENRQFFIEQAKAAKTISEQDMYGTFCQATSYLKHMWRGKTNNI